MGCVRKADKLTKFGIISKESYRRSGIDVSGKIIDVHKEQERTKYGTLRYTRRNRKPVRVNTIQNNSLISVCEVTVKPREKRPSDTISVELEKE